MFRPMRSSPATRRASFAQRFDEDTVATLEQIAWWDWDAEKLTRNLDAIRGTDLAALRAAA